MDHDRSLETFCLVAIFVMLAVMAAMTWIQEEIQSKCGSGYDSSFQR